MSIDTAASSRPSERHRSVPVGIIGFGWMGRVHAQAYLRVRHHYPDLVQFPALVAIADEAPGRAQDAARQFGAERALTDWRALLDDPELRAVSVTAPNFLHREIGVAVAESGKHLWIEKPVGLTAADALDVALAADTQGVRTAVGFNYRNAPAVAAARELLARGELGDITHARFYFLSDYAAHPDGALSWRYQQARGGNGVLGDLASHAVDLVHHLLGPVDAVVADTAVFIPQRPLPTGATSGHELAAGGARGLVENEDYVIAQMRMASGARCSVEASRVAVGEQNAYGFEIHGTAGVVGWDFRRIGELRVGVGAQYQDQPVTTRFVGPGDGEYGAFQPGSAIALGYDDLKVIEAQRFLASIASGEPAGATIWDAVAAARVIEAIGESVRTGSWVRPEASGPTAP
ncbi:putative dehydrogenase [Mycolicibacterium iranicum]|uniref:Putative dehydrogenase n=1 Tax=Mycolicibacterium iranicum TaxID=912594 RepID=A0A839QBZ5_MYCIR|nr:Gfo/Idh/MocA family oxidoreductase [Mycolicibacterium iranicum]MBB2991716.1 putative dehydrogenase [Mycolicibacterium iranicum]